MVSVKVVLIFLDWLYGDVLVFNSGNVILSLRSQHVTWSWLQHLFVNGGDESVVGVGWVLYLESINQVLWQVRVNLNFGGH